MTLYQVHPVIGVIDTETGEHIKPRSGNPRWDVFDIYTKNQTKTKALAWFAEHDGHSYDYRNVVRYVLPFIGHNKNHWGVL